MKEQRTLILLCSSFRLQTTISDALPATTGNYRQIVSLPQCKYQCCQTKHQLKLFLTFFRLQTTISDFLHANTNAVNEMVCYSHLFFNSDIIKSLSFEFTLWILVLNPPFNPPFWISLFESLLWIPLSEFPNSSLISLSSANSNFRFSTGNYRQLPAKCFAPTMQIPMLSNQTPAQMPSWLFYQTFYQQLPATTGRAFAVKPIKFWITTQQFQTSYRQLPAKRGTTGKALRSHNADTNEVKPNTSSNALLFC